MLIKLYLHTEFKYMMKTLQRKKKKKKKMLSLKND